jgi:hypothetical protein
MADHLIAPIPEPIIYDMSRGDAMCDLKIVLKDKSVCPLSDKRAYVQ